MRVHVLQHVPFEGLGSIEAWLSAKNAQVTYTRFFVSPSLPNVAERDLVIALGGPMSVNDERSLMWLVREKGFIAEAVRAGKSVLGICLGAQLIASSLGARVYPGPNKEIGWFPIHSVPTAQDAFTFPELVEVFHWHGETFDLPEGAAHLVRSAGCEHQAFQIGPRVMGLQFHLEMTSAGVEAIISNCRQEMIQGKFIQPEAAMRATPSRSYAKINSLMSSVLEYLVRDVG